MISGRLPQGPDEVALGSAFADKLGATSDSDVRLIIPLHGRGRGGRARRESAPRVQCRSGIVKMGMYEYDSKWVFTTLEAAQKFFGQEREGDLL